MNRYIFYLFVFKVAEVPGIKIFRFEANLYFANADQFRDRLYDKTKINPRKLKSKKQKVLYKSLLQRKREIELAEIDAKAERKRTKVRQSLVICVMFCRSLFVLLSFIIWPLYCLSFNVVSSTFL